VTRSTVVALHTVGTESTHSREPIAGIVDVEGGGFSPSL
jgi:hypothetical protein